jgi:hypothetical protein
VQVGDQGWSSTGDRCIPPLQTGTAAHGRHYFGCQCLAHSPLLGDGLECPQRHWAPAEDRLLSGAGEFEAQLLDGTVGPAATSELVAFLRLFHQLPSIDEILLNPDTAPLPTETSAQIAIATALGRVVTDNSIARGLRYLDRMPTEMRVMAVRDAAARDTAITHTPEFVRFGVEYREVV